MRTHISVVDALTEHEHALADARAADHWMAVVYFVKDGQTYCRKTSWQFPLGDLERAPEMLTRLLEKERKGGPQVVEPLPVAKLLSKMMAPSVTASSVREIREAAARDAADDDEPDDETSVSVSYPNPG